jgi:hypothetical protein
VTRWAGPAGWQHSPIDPQVPQRWQPGLGLGLVCGVAFDVIDVDPRHGGDQSIAGLREAGLLPRVFGWSRTPRGGAHYYVVPLGIGSRDGIAPGVDLKGGRLDGTGRGFVFEAPTVRRGGTYSWGVVPDLDGLAEGDETGEALAEYVRGLRTGEAWDDTPTPVYIGPPPTGRQAAYLAAMVRNLSTELRETPEGSRNRTLFTAAMKCASFAAGAGLDTETARAALREAGAAAGLGDLAMTRTWASGYRIGHTHPRAVPPAAGDQLPAQPVDPAAAQSSPPRLDPIAFRGVLGDAVELVRDTTEADPVGVLASLMAGVGALMGPTPHLRIGGTRHPPLIWPLLFGRTGSGRKGEATNVAEVVLGAADSIEFVRVRTSGLSSGEGLIEAIRDPTEVKRGKITETVGTRDKRLFVVEPEFGSVMARARREGNTLAAVLRQAWDGRALRVLNRAALTASGSHVAVVGHVTPREFRMRLAEAEMSGGLYNRFLPLYVERTRLLPVPPPVATGPLADIGAALHEGLAFARARSAPVTLDGDAERAWVGGLYAQLAEVDDSDAAWTEFSRRAAPYALRVAAIYALLDRRGQINGGDLDAAAAVVRYGGDTAKYVLGGQSRDPRLDRIRRALHDDASGLSRTEISGLFGRNLAAHVLDELLSTLCGSGDFERAEVRAPGQGRNVTLYRPTTKETKETN